MVFQYNANTLVGLEDRRSVSESVALEVLQLEAAQKNGIIPATFPIDRWSAQAIRYRTYWSWFNGDVLEETVGQTKDGRPIYRYPLKINPVRNFAQKHVNLLFGEVPDTPTPLVKIVAAPKALIANPSDALKKSANFCASLVNEVWTASSGRSIQEEAGLNSQFLGGAVFQIDYVPWRTDLLVPLKIKYIYPDFFLPVWKPDDYNELLEAFVVYRLNPVEAHLNWQLTDTSAALPIYVEHWTKDHYTIMVDGKPLQARYPDGTTITYFERPNPWGFVPFEYIPRLRAGNFYGLSFVPNVSGLALELNARTADEGDAMRLTAHPRYKGRNLTNQIQEKSLDNRGNTYLDLGMKNPLTQADPELDNLDPPEWTESFSQHKTYLWSQMMREGDLGPIAYGEDEGSQRSALTLAFRMYPSTSMARRQRSYWTDGLRRIAHKILSMSAQIGVSIDGQRVPANFAQQIDLSPDWLPMIPRDREAQVNEIVALVQAGLMSPEKALEDLGNVPDVKVELERIRDWLTFRAELDMSTGQAGDGSRVQTRQFSAQQGLKEEPTE